MKLNIHIIPQEIIDEYALHKIVDEDGWVYLDIVKGVYGLKQAGIIANMELTKYLENFGYHPVQNSPGLWKHNTRATIFTLVVDDFAIKYASKQDSSHLILALCAKYTIYTDWYASLYIGITLNWNYTAGFGPAPSKRGNLGPCLRPWRGIGAVRRITAICQFRARCKCTTSMA